jgi:coenzyme F420-0:L-glutamate ligase / coenzyme F420-1:gamma-L-glutamate ligase
VPARIEAFAIAGIPEIQPGDRLGEIVAGALTRARVSIEPGDVFVIAQKIVSKAENAMVRLDTIAASARAAAWAADYGKDPGLVEIVLREAARIVRMERGVVIAETRHGFVCANAGVDASNVAPGWVTVLPRDPDGSAARIRTTLIERLGVDVAVVIADTFGRPWREGVINVAIGVAGLRPLDDCRGRLDAFGRRLHSTVIAIADEIASAAELVMGKANHAPVAVVRGAAEWIGAGSGAALVRPAEQDLFR